MTLGKADMKSVRWCLFGSNELFNLWKEVCDMWTAGKLPDGMGNKGNPREEKFMNPALFRAFEGQMIKPDEIIWILSEVKKKRVLLIKSTVT